MSMESGFFKIPDIPKPPDPLESNGDGDGDGEHSGFTFQKPSKVSITRKRRPSVTSIRSEASCTSIESENLYSALDDDAEDTLPAKPKRYRKDNKTEKSSNKSKAGNSPINNEEPKKDPTPPPVIVKKLNIKQLSDILKDLSVDQQNINIKLTQHGTKIYVKQSSDFKVLKNFLIEKEVEFYTHQLKEEKLNKFVLYGLPNFEISEIENELKSKNYFPVEIKKLNIKNSRYENHTNYLCYFKKSDQVRLRDLREIKSIFQVIVHWNYYSHRPNDVTQCSNCQGFGHGTRNCHLQPICVKCAGGHKSKECPLDNERDENGKIPDRRLFCHHCTHHHTANYNKCVKRLEFIARQKTFGKNKTNQQRPNQFVPAPELASSRFPAIQRNLNSNLPPWQSQNLHPQFNSTQSNFNTSFHQSSTKNSQDLFTPEQCFSIFTEFISKLSTCKSRQDQLMVIGEITFKYMK